MDVLITDRSNEKGIPYEGDAFFILVTQKNV
jgi:hypothetical protein